jgi:hypothetical protein
MSGMGRDSSVCGYRAHGLCHLLELGVLGRKTANICLIYQQDIIFSGHDPAQYLTITVGNFISGWKNVARGLLLLHRSPP